MRLGRYSCGLISLNSVQTTSTRYATLVCWCHASKQERAVLSVTAARLHNAHPIGWVLVSSFSVVPASETDSANIDGREAIPGDHAVRRKVEQEATQRRQTYQSRHNSTYVDMASKGSVSEEKCYSRSAVFADELRSAHLGSADANFFYHGNMMTLEKQGIDPYTSRILSERSTT